MNSPQTCGRGSRLPLAEDHRAPRRGQPRCRRGAGRPAANDQHFGGCPHAGGLIRPTAKRNGKQAATVVGSAASPAVVEQPLPVLPLESARHRNRRVVADHPVHAQERRRETGDDVRDHMPPQVVDQPAERGALVHPMEEADQPGIIQVMGEEGADHDVRPDRRRQIEDVAGEVADRAIPAALLAPPPRPHADSDRPRSGRPPRPDARRRRRSGAACRRSPQPTSTTTSGRVSPCRSSSRSSQRSVIRYAPVQRLIRSRSRRHASTLAGSVASSVHELGRGAAPSQIDHPRPSNIRLSIARPGPNAMAQPGPRTRLASISLSTNSTVADDMLP